MTPPKTKKLFISYRSSDAVKVDKIAHDLTLLQYDDGTPRYTTWQDKHNLPPASPHWWGAIVDAIDDCDVFVFHMSCESLQSVVCLAELDYAYNRNRPIIPVVLEGEFLLDPKSGKYNITYWELVPDWLGERQFLFYTGTDFFGRFQQAIEMFERKWPRDIYAPRPLNPDNKSVHGSNHALYDAACDYAERLAFEDARKHFNALVRRNDKDYADVAAQWLELLGFYAELIEIDGRRSARFIFNTKWSAYQALFPKDFLDGIFDPKGFHGSNGGTSTPVTTQVVSTAPPAPAPPKLSPAPPKPTSLSLMPAPFAWIEIPGKGYSIAKYPMTNAQFAEFIEAGGYDEPKWWNSKGWQHRKIEKWRFPRYWSDKNWNRDEQPVVGVSWYEAEAFCNWLSAITQEQIRLPNQNEWEFAAGYPSISYPWGDRWDCSKCCCSVSPCIQHRTVSVRNYEGLGDSAFGVVDMLGNVWEWCLETVDEKGVLRGCCWKSKEVNLNRRIQRPLKYGFNQWGFRLVRAEGDEEFLSSSTLAKLRYSTLFDDDDEYQ